MAPKKAPAKSRMAPPPWMGSKGEMPEKPMMKGKGKGKMPMKGKKGC